jgi:hypothetical protein
LLEDLSVRQVSFLQESRKSGLVVQIPQEGIDSCSDNILASTAALLRTGSAYKAMIAHAITANTQTSGARIESFLTGPSVVRKARTF